MQQHSLGPCEMAACDNRATATVAGTRICTPCNGVVADMVTADAPLVAANDAAESDQAAYEKANGLTGDPAPAGWVTLTCH
ncbi:hypothetical protein ACQP25_44665 (plasmid) [Microtetraspora malaysiensis]|uniref:hypothetical protein n=1 Tax=Microtetraspora malaysiensis TaxID=161358 RepID=UPI003D8DF2EA